MSYIKTIIKKAGTIIGARRSINFIEGTNVTLTIVDDSGSDEVDVTISASGGGGSGFSTLSANATSTFLSEENSIVTTVLSALITSANFKTFTVIPTETTETSLDDFTLNGVTFNIENIVDGVSFDIRASSINNATGVYSYKYIITYS